ncbi:TonB-dependent receptor domain-containing protein [Opitutus terrae]|nr:TonB-dependent receptor [Opitutus terrae]
MARRWLGLALVFAVLGPLARAAPTRFDLPTQPAATALMAFAKQAGVEVLFSFDELKAVQSNAVAGLFEPAEAIDRLLRGTGFTAIRNSAGKFVVVSERNRRRTGEVQGHVVADATGQPVANALVRLVDSTLAVRTRADGFFRLPEVPAEWPTLLVQAEGFTTARVEAVFVAAHRSTQLGPIRLTAGEDLQALEAVVVDASELGGTGPPAFLLEEVIVTPSRFGIEEERGLVAAMLTEADLLALPQVGEDLYRAISHLPGLAADDITARFWVRGAPHDQVLARLDGVELIEPFHMKDTDSSLSILDLETISRLNLLTGGFTAEFGDRLAGVLTMETDRYVRAKPRTTLGMSMTGARVASRGATPSGRSHWLVSARTGYPQVALRVRGADDSTELKPRYHDVFAKWETNLTPNQTLAVHALHAADRMTMNEGTQAQLHSRYGSDYAWLRWQGDFGAVQGEAVLSHAQLSWSRRASGLWNRWYELGAADERELRTTSFRQDWTAKWHPRVLLRAGMQVTTGRADFDYHGFHEALVSTDAGLIKTRQFRDLTVAPAGESWGTYLAVRAQPGGGWTVEPGVRFDGNNYAHDADVSPRFNAAWSRGATTLRFGWGRFHQAQPLYRLGVLDGETRFYPSERAEHRVVGLERRLRGGINLRLEAYERAVNRPQPHWENGVETLESAPEQGYDRLRLDPLRQRARGLELIAERRGTKLSWSGSYGLARSEETLRSGVTIARARDQRHTVYLDVTYTPNRRWQFSLAGQYHTGWPTTELDFHAAPYAEGGTVVYGELRTPFAERLPAYQRVDLRIQRRFELKRGTLRLYVDIFNVFDRENMISYGHNVTVRPDDSLEVRRTRGDLLMPLIPSVGFTWDF